MAISSSSPSSPTQGHAIPFVSTKPAHIVLTGTQAPFAREKSLSIAPRYFFLDNKSAINSSSWSSSDGLSMCAFVSFMDETLETVEFILGNRHSFSTAYLRL